MVTQLERPSRIERRRDGQTGNRVDNNDPDRYRINFKKEALHKLKIKDIRKAAKDAYEVLGKKTTTPQPLPKFPHLLFSLVLIKDLTVDIAADLTGVGTVAVMLLSIVTAILLFFWYWGKTSTGKWKEKFLRFLIVAIIIKFIPIINIIPSEAILMLIVYFRETKAIKVYNIVVAQLAKVGALDDMLEHM